MAYSSSRRSVHIRTGDVSVLPESGGSRSSRDAMLAASASNRKQRFNRMSPNEIIARYEATHSVDSREQPLPVIDDDDPDDWRRLADLNDNKIDGKSGGRYIRESSNVVRENGWSEINRSSPLMGVVSGALGRPSPSLSQQQQQQQGSRIRQSSSNYVNNVTSSDDRRFPSSRLQENDGGRRLYTSGLASTNDGAYNRQNGARSVGGASGGADHERNFLFKVQQELEEQRESWKSEIDRLTHSASAMDMRVGDETDSMRRGGSGRSSTNFLDAAAARGTPSPFNAETSSYVDTRDRRGPVFKAFVDVSEYDPEDVHVSIDKLSNRVVVEASTEDRSNIGRTFTQRIQLPQFAHDAGMTARMNQRGILRIEVPLLYYFPPSERDVERDSRAKSFVYEVRADPNNPSRQLMEILVNTGRDVSARDLRIEHDGDQLIVLADVPSQQSGFDRKVIKRYTLPPMTDVNGITSKLGRDGRLTILIPIMKK